MSAQEPGAGPGMLWAGAGIMAYAQIQQGQEQSEILSANERALKVEARSVLWAGEENARRIEDAGERVEGEMAAMVGASGVTMTGSPLAVMIDHAAQVDVEARTTLFAAQQQAKALREQARAMRGQARAARRAGYIGAGATLLMAGTRAQ